MIVIDVGCARYGGDYSVERLLEMYRPGLLIGFDPNPDVSKAMPASISEWMPEGGLRGIELRREAAWTYDGEIGYHADGLNSQVGTAKHWRKVRCVDLARIIEELPEGPVVLKLDAEGAEYELLEHLLATGAIHRLSRVLVEWHDRGDPQRRRALEKALRDAEIVYEQWRW